MASKPPSKTTARDTRSSTGASGASLGVLPASGASGVDRVAGGTPPGSGASRGVLPASGVDRVAPVLTGLPAGAVRAIRLLVSVAFLAIVPLAAGCGATDAIPASSGDKLTPGTIYSVDLDGDGVAEQVLVNGSPASLTITDGEVVYRSRDRWHVVEAGLGDTDRDGLLEVVTLLDDHEGRHLGLFAYFRGEYRERLVTSELDPRPITFEVVSSEQAAGADQGTPAASTGDLLRLIVEPAPGQTAPQTVLCRWNGFGFTGIE